MKKTSIRIIIGLMSFALVGVVTMQLYFLWQSYDMQSKLFDRSVNEALSNVAIKASKHDAMHFLSSKVPGNYVPDKSGHLKIIEKTTITDSGHVSTIVIARKKHNTYRERKIAMLRDSLKKMILQKQIAEQFGGAQLQIRVEEYTDEVGIEHRRFTPEIVKTNIHLPKNQKLHKYDTLKYVYDDPLYGSQVIFAKRINPLWQHEQEVKQNERKFREVKRLLETDSLQNLQVGHAAVIQNLAAEYQKFGEPLKTRIDPLWIDSLLRFELRDKGIDLPFTYEVTNANNDSLIFSNASYHNSGGPAQFTADNTYQTHIFSTDVINDPGNIKITFPQKNTLILNRMTASMATTGGLLLVLIFCFGYTLFSIIKQKKIAEMKTDFINNMTHEFKTPVSTIMIASEALKDQEIIADKTRVARLANVIYEENARLGSHIERVLNVARIERNDFKLEKKPLDVNEMINIVIDSMALKLQKHQVALTLNLDAINAVVLADELHFSNLIYNLIDNAIKYSTGTPEITISTSNRADQIVIKVADKGIGMSRDQQTKIFEQFYRIPTGNLHDVKGFGLGLSYVNTIVKRLNGVISVRSEKDKGSDFELKFPLA